MAHGLQIERQRADQTDLHEKSVAQAQKQDVRGEQQAFRGRADRVEGSNSGRITGRTPPDENNQSDQSDTEDSNCPRPGDIDTEVLKLLEASV